MSINRIKELWEQSPHPHDFLILQVNNRSYSDSMSRTANGGSFLYQILKSIKYLNCNNKELRNGLILRLKEKKGYPIKKIEEVLGGNRKCYTHDKKNGKYKAKRIVINSS